MVECFETASIIWGFFKFKAILFGDNHFVKELRWLWSESEKVGERLRISGGSWNLKNPKFEYRETK